MYSIGTNFLRISGSDQRMIRFQGWFGINFLRGRERSSDGDATRTRTAPCGRLGAGSCASGNGSGAVYGFGSWVQFMLVGD